MKNKVGRPSRFDENQKILKKVKNNPRRKGSKAHENFKKIKNGMKVSTYVSKGGDVRDLRYSADKGWVEVIDAQPSAINL